MRKLPFLLVGIIIIISLCFVSTISYAQVNESTIDYEVIYGEEDFYYLFDTPTSIAYNGSVLATYDNDKIIILDNGISRTIPFNVETTEIVHIILTQDYLFILTNELELISYNLSDLTLNTTITSAIMTEIEFVDSITYDYENSILYALGTNHIYSYELDSQGIIDQQQIVVDNPLYIRQSNCISYSSNSLYVYKISNRKIYTVDLVTNTVSETITDIEFDTQYIRSNGNYIFLIRDNNNQQFISLYYKDGTFIGDILATSSENKDHTLTEIGDVAVYNNQIFISDSTYSAIKVFDIYSNEESYNRSTFSHMYGASGTGIKRLNEPHSITTRGSYLYISDTNNDRVVKYNIDNDNNIIGTPLTIGTSGNDQGQFIQPQQLALDTSYGLYIADTTGRLQYFLRDEYVTTYNFTDISSIVVNSNNDVYILDSVNNTIYFKSFNDSSFQELFTLDTPPHQIAMSSSGRVVYVYDDEGIKAYSNNGDLLPYSIDFEEYVINSPDAFSVDYSGNIFILEDKVIYSFKRNIDDYTLNDIYTLNPQLSLIDSIQDMHLASDGKIYLTNTNYHNIISIPVDTINVTTQGDIDFDHPTEIVYPSRIAYINSTSTIYFNPKNYEDIDTVPEDACILVLNEITYDNVNYYYIEYNNQYAYIRQSDTILMSAGNSPMDYVKSLHPTLNIYLYPSVNSPIAYPNISRDNNIEVISNVAQMDNEQMWDWYEVRYSIDDDTSISGYVLKTEVVPASMPEVLQETFHAKIKSPQLGEKVNLYSLEDTHSAIIITISDGEKVEINEPINSNSEFTLIRYNDYVGYVETQYLAEDGLTTGQILSIILASVTFTATVIVLIISRLIKKEIRY